MRYMMVIMLFCGCGSGGSTPSVSDGAFYKTSLGIMNHIPTSAQNIVYHDTYISNDPVENISFLNEQLDMRLLEFLEKYQHDREHLWKVAQRSPVYGMDAANFDCGYGVSWTGWCTGMESDGTLYVSIYASKMTETYPEGIYAYHTLDDTARRCSIGKPVGTNVWCQQQPALYIYGVGTRFYPAYGHELGHAAYGGNFEH